MSMTKGDSPEAPCFDAPEEAQGYRGPQHKWRSLMKDPTALPRIECCPACGAMRSVEKDEPAS